MADLTEAQHDEYRTADPRKRNEQGQIVDVRLMTEREIAEETLILLRAFGEALQAVGQSPMVRAIPGMSKMFGK